MFILYGATSRNGKGTAMETFLKIMGDYGKTSNPDMLAAKFRGGNTGGPSEEVARLVGSRFVNISEPEKKITFNAALVKRMTGNDTINARFLNENSFDFVPVFKIFINTNYLPNVNDMTLFQSGRLKIIPFNRHFEEGEQGGAGDQGIMYGYATNETAEQMPIPYLVATKFLQLLKNHPSKMFRADAKAQVSYDYGTGRITTFLCSVQHSPDVEVSDFRHIIESMMVLAACEYGLDGDFTKLVNPTGRFVLGGSYADCGVTGRKLACDTYGGIGRMGGGALSGKDPTKVDRSAAYMARKIAKDIVQAGYADKCEVQLAYAIGVIQPVGVAVECFGTEHQSLDFIEAYVHDSYDLTPQGIIKRLGLLDVDYNKVSAYGHFGKAGLPWED